MNLLQEQLCDFAKDRFNPTAKPLFIIAHGVCIPTLGVSFAPDQQTYFVTLNECIFPFIERIRSIGCNARQQAEQAA